MTPFPAYNVQLLGGDTNAYIEKAALGLTDLELALWLSDLGCQNIGTTKSSLLKSLHDYLITMAEDKDAKKDASRLGQLPNAPPDGVASSALVLATSGGTRTSSRPNTQEQVMNALAGLESFPPPDTPEVDGLGGGAARSMDTSSGGTQSSRPPNKQQQIMDALGIWDIMWEDIVVGECIGGGSFGKVCHC